MGGETLELVAHRSCGCPIPCSAQGQVEQDLELPGLVEGVPAHDRGARTRSVLRSLPIQTYDTMMIVDELEPSKHGIQPALVQYFP